MYRNIVLALAVIAVAAKSSPFVVSGEKIVGGVPVAIGSRPFQVSRYHFEPEETSIFAVAQF